MATNCSQLKMESADGKNYLTDVADEQIAAPLQALIDGRILALREQRVMLDADLAEL